MGRASPPSSAALSMGGGVSSGALSGRPAGGRRRVDPARPRGRDNSGPKGQIKGEGSDPECRRHHEELVNDGVLGAEGPGELRYTAPQPGATPVAHRPYHKQLCCQL